MMAGIRVWDAKHGDSRPLQGVTNDYQHQISASISQGIVQVTMKYTDCLEA